MPKLSLCTKHQMHGSADLEAGLLGSSALCQAVSSDSCGQVATQTMGTVTHMPPELLMEGLLTKAGDVWAFGILMWWVQQLFWQAVHCLPSYMCTRQQAAM